MNKIMKIKTSVAKEVLAEYNKIMEGNSEEPYIITEDWIGDCEEGVLRDTAWSDNGDRTPDEYIVDLAYLLEEMRWNLCEKQYGMADDAVDNGEITPQKAAGIKRHNRKLVSDFEKFAAGFPKVEPWVVNAIEGYED